MKRQGWTLLWLVVCWVFLYLPPAQAIESGLKAYTAKYRLSRGQLTIGHAEISLRIDASGNYTYRGHTTAAGLVAVFRDDEIIEQSNGSLNRNQVTPSSYSYQHKKKKGDREVNLKFDWRNGQVTNRSAAGHWSMDIPAGTQDDFSHQLALMLELTHGRNATHFKVADGGRLKDYRFERRQGQTVDLTIGQYDTIKLERIKDNRPPDVRLWLAPDLNYLPVRVEKQKKNGIFVMELTTLQWD